MTIMVKLFAQNFDGKHTSETYGTTVQTSISLQKAWIIIFELVKAIWGVDDGGKRIAHLESISTVPTSDCYSFSVSKAPFVASEDEPFEIDYPSESEVLL